jgi:hypothetical protein
METAISNVPAHMGRALAQFVDSALQAAARGGCGGCGN